MSPHRCVAGKSLRFRDDGTIAIFATYSRRVAAQLWSTNDYSQGVCVYDSQGYPTPRYDCRSRAELIGCPVRPWFSCLMVSGYSSVLSSNRDYCFGTFSAEWSSKSFGVDTDQILDWRDLNTWKHSLP